MFNFLIALILFLIFIVIINISTSSKIHGYWRNSKGDLVLITKTGFRTFILTSYGNNYNGYITDFNGIHFSNKISGRIYNRVMHLNNNDIWYKQGI